MKVYEYIVRLKDQANDKAKRFLNTLDSGRGKIYKFNRILDDTDQSARNAGNGLGILSRWLGPLALGAALSAGITKSSALAREFEQTRISYEVLLGDVQKGRKMLSETIDLAMITPFTSRELQASGKLLLGYGTDAQKIIPTLRMLGDISGGNADRLHLLSLAFAQSQAAGRLMGQDLLQMVNSGFNPLQVISEKTGLSMAKLKKKMEDGAISAKMVEAAFRIATEEGGRFFRMMEKQSETFEGRMSTLTDKAEIFATKFGLALNEHLKPILETTISVLDRLLDKEQGMANGAKSFADEFNTLYTKISPLVDEYDKLNSIITKTTEQQARFNEVAKILAKEIPIAGTGFNPKTGLYDYFSPGRARRFIKDQEQDFLDKNQEAQDAVNIKLSRLTKDREIYSGMIEKYKSGDVKGFLFSRTQKDNINDIKKSKLALDRISEEESKLNDTLKKLQEERSSAYQLAPTSKGTQLDPFTDLKKGKDGTDKITGGGKQPINVTINVERIVGIETIEKVIGEMGIKDLKAKLEDVAIEAMLRVVNSANYAATQ